MGSRVGSRDSELAKVTKVIANNYRSPSPAKEGE
jgi:hypothetical protein